MKLKPFLSLAGGIVAIGATLIGGLAFAIDSHTMAQTALDKSKELDVKVDKQSEDISAIKEDVSWIREHLGGKRK